MAGTFEDSSHAPAPNFIIFGEIGVGKSSLINLIAGANLATVSSGVTCCTLQSTEFKVRLHDYQCEVNLYDTVRERLG
jgi:predicted GTPase